jgi:hypothetical protein
MGTPMLLRVYLPQPLRPEPHHVLLSELFSLRIRFSLSATRRDLLIFFSTILFAGSTFSGWAKNLPLNPIQLENLKEGTREWSLANPASNREIEGYASRTSVGRGESIALFVNTSDPSYIIDLFRLGWYGGLGARRMIPTTWHSGVRQPQPSFDAGTGLVACHWGNPYTISVPLSPSSDWVSGMYLAKLTALPSKRESYIVFVVRDDERSSALLFQSSVATYQAYNDWGGWSLYTKPEAYKVSFDRPYAEGFGAPELFSGAWEFSMLRFLEREGWDVSYSTDVDTHEHGEYLLRHRGFLVVGHDEYWSAEMRFSLERARLRGLNLGFFSADDGYWQIRYEPSVSGDPDRVIVCYRKPQLDPLFYSAYPAQVLLTTTAFRDPPLDNPEAALIGVMFDHGHGEEGDIVIEDASHWVFDHTGLKKGDHLKGLLGYEVDRLYNSSPAGIQLLAHSPYQQEGVTRYSDMTIYATPVGNVVIATGSMQWCWGLDSFPYPERLNSAAQQATRNILTVLSQDYRTPDNNVSRGR